jgi:hypothetical protein
VSDNSSNIIYVFGAAIELLSSRYLATKGYIYIYIYIYRERERERERESMAPELFAGKFVKSRSPPCP